MRNRIVNVLPGQISPTTKCDTIKNCKNIAKFLVFGWDGQPKMSRLEFITCEKHLSIAVKKTKKKWSDKKYDHLFSEK